MLPEWLMQREWTSESIKEWQTFYDNASRRVAYGFSGNFSNQFLPHLPKYQDLDPPPCKKGIPSSAVRESFMFYFSFISFFSAISRMFA